jgi:predicted RNA methylase
LEKAMEVGQVVYSLHNHPRTDKKLLKRLNASPEHLMRVAPSLFLENFIKGHNCTIKAVYALPMSIPRMFTFHTRIKHDFIIDLYHIEKKK